MKILFSFPGQGAQYTNMLHQLPKSEVTQQVLNLASDVLQEDILNLDSETALKNTRSVQLCILITGVIYANLLQQQGVEADYVSGLSIGAFPAAVFSGALDLSDAIKIVSLRGELMQHAYPQGYGLTSIQGLLEQQVCLIVEQVNSDQYPVYIANFNDEQQFVIAGSDQAMLKVAQLAKKMGARKVVKLAISVPSHCPLLTKTAHQLAQAMDNISIKIPRISYLSANNARIINQVEKLRDDLAYNMARSVYWHETMTAAYERGVRIAIEMPPGAVLTGLTKKVMDQGEVIALNQVGIIHAVQLVKILT
ncbi:malonate decarboxylase subunit epsilon [Frischella perrara]|uniref:Malonyl CoA-acyl carrier protein transacylase n=1 Tax=Frischella perrara TaxID=1267021 RepID=A0A0A7S637_FRIPE|nr:malonate decarboxylase subunit epsilon [Frischella perrara]AJA44751.1 malonate decarboxylase, epsilon subunit [Frischella perrara]PWV64927.1 malonate decarboxylase epsilon subunit [Frischella perrara]PXY95611.1 malonate decarboxylase subunit epsilon [Frischella perrara]